MNAVAGVRRRFDPLADYIPAHITLVFPFESEISEVELRQHIEKATAGIRAFPVGFGQVVGTDDQYLLLTFTQGVDEVAGLHDHLYTGPLLPFLSAEIPFVPHITVGRLTTPDDLRNALQLTRSLELGRGTTANSVATFRIDKQQEGSIEFEVPLG